MNFSWITPHLALGGRLTDREASRLSTEWSVGAVVDLRSEAVDDAALFHARGVAFLHLPTDDHAAIAPAMLDAGVAFVLHHHALGTPTLIHCEHGIGRSATLALAVLVATGTAPIEALHLAKDKHERLSPSPAQYDCWRDWLRARRHQRGETWEVPDFDRFAAVAYRHLAPATP